MNDIDYFSEKRLNDVTLGTFYRNLPFRLREFVDPTWDVTFVLQGYRGPRRLCDGSSGDSKSIGSTNGIQTVKFRHATSKLALIAPTIFVAGRLLLDNDWQTLYFEEESGELLSNNLERAKEILQERSEA